MTKIEQTALDFLKKHLGILIFIAASAAGILLRVAGMEFRSDDFNSFLSGWWNVISAQEIDGLATQVGNYNIPYQIIIFLMTRVTADALGAYKMLSIVFDFALAFGCMLLVAEFTKKKLTDFVPMLTYAAVLCSLTVVFNSAFWAQCDSIYVTFIVFAVYFTMKDKPIAAFVLLGVSLAFKLQMVFILPLFLYYYVSTRRVSLLHFLLIPAADIVMCLPAVLCGRNFLDIFTIYAEQTDYGKLIQMNCPNLYAFFCNGMDVNNYYLLKPMTIVITMAVLLAGLLAVMKKGVDLRNPEKLLMTAVWTAFTCLMLLSSMHERYSYLLDILLLVYFFVTRKHPFVVVACHLVSLRGYGYYLFGNFEALSLKETSIIYIGIYAYVTFLFIRETLMDRETARLLK